MGLNGNGVGRANGTISSAPPNAGSTRRPRRLVLLTGDAAGPVETVLAEYHGTEVSGARLHTDAQRLAAEHPGHTVAGEWLSQLGWTRFLWCRK
jgi:hypothetical protein